MCKHGPGLRWMNSTQASALAGSFERRARSFHSRASVRRRRPTPQERERSCVSDAAPTRKEVQGTTPAARRPRLTRPSGEPGPPRVPCRGQHISFPTHCVHLAHAPYREGRADTATKA